MGRDGFPRCWESGLDGLCPFSGFFWLFFSFMFGEFLAWDFLNGIYLSVHSLCMRRGYFIGLCA